VRYPIPDTPELFILVAQLRDEYWRRAAALGYPKPSLTAELDLWAPAARAVDRR
jgi:hypothetical protein